MASLFFQLRSLVAEIFLGLAIEIEPSDDARVWRAYTALTTAKLMALENEQ